MILAAPAARYTRVAAGQTGVQIAGGSSIRVHGVLFSSTGASTLTLLENDGTTVIASFSMPGGVSFEVKTGFLADKGLRVTTDATGVCTVFHSNGGA